MSRKKNRKPHRTPNAERRRRAREAKRPPSADFVAREGVSQSISLARDWYVLRVEINRERGTALRLAAGQKTGPVRDKERIAASKAACFFPSDDGEVHLYFPRDLIQIEFRGRSIARGEATFPGYLFAGVRRGASLHARCCWFEGVLDAVGGWVRPSRIDAKELRALERWLTGEQRKVKPPKYAFKLGEIVRVTEGAFRGFPAEIEALAPGLATVLVNIFGRPTRVDLLPGEFSAQ